MNIKKRTLRNSLTAAVLVLAIALFSGCSLFGGCSHKMQYVAAVQPTCENTGMSEYWHCKKCGGNFIDEAGNYKHPLTPVRAKGHLYTKSEVIEAASCEKAGTRRRMCGREGCDSSLEEPIPALGHDYGDWDETAPTCAQDGVNTRRCQRQGCGSVESEPIAATGKHKWADGAILSEPSCTVDGERSLLCKTCGATRTVKIPATEHTYTVTTVRTATCLVEGEEERVCSVCTESETVVTPKLLHDYSTDNSCRKCGQSTLTPSSKVTYRLVTSVQPSYAVVSAATVFSGEDLVIAATYQGRLVREIEASVFENKKSIRSVYIPDTVTKIGDKAFSGCTKLTKVTIGRGVTEIGTGAFEICPISEIHIDNAVDWCQIDGASELCAAKLYVRGQEITDLRIEGVESIASSAFSDAPIRSLHIGASVTQIRSFAFSGCASLERITVDPANTVYRAEGNCLIEIATNTVILGCKNSYIPGGVTTIGNRAFYATQIQYVTLPASVTTINPSAFVASELQSVYFEVTEGWKCTSRAQTFAVDAAKLTDAWTAAELLSGRDGGYTWVREP